LNVNLRKGERPKSAESERKKTTEDEENYIWREKGPTEKKGKRGLRYRKEGAKKPRPPREEKGSLGEDTTFSLIGRYRKEGGG